MFGLLFGLLLVVMGSPYGEHRRAKQLYLPIRPEVIFPNPEMSLAKANNEFAFKIFNQLSGEDNDVLSSLSILSAFSILMNGAKGETLGSLIRFLNYDSDPNFNLIHINRAFEVITHKYRTNNTNETEEKTKNFGLYDAKASGHQLNIANRVIHNKDINLLDKFVNTVKTYYGADTQTADFRQNGVKEVEKINEWIRNKTNDKIKKLFDSIDFDTSLIILNALYFKGNWFEPFDSELTQKLDFYNNGENAVKVETMTAKEDYNYFDSEELDSQVLELQYEGNEISFVIVLPKQRNGLQTLKSKLNLKTFDKTIDSLQRNYVNVFVPKFKVEKTYDLMKDINSKPTALTPNADYSGLTSDKSLIVCEILHKVFIAVDERGTEAAAVTAIRAVPESLVIHPDPIVFRAYHPFLFFIRDKTNEMILFSGQINRLN